MSSMRLEELRFLHEDIERLEQAISDRYAEIPRNGRSTSSCSKILLTPSRFVKSASKNTKSRAFFIVSKNNHGASAHLRPTPMVP